MLTLFLRLTLKQINKLLSNPVDLQEFLEKELDMSANVGIINENAPIIDKTTKEMDEIIDSLREQIKRETMGYQLPSGR